MKEYQEFYTNSLCSLNVYCLESFQSDLNYILIQTLHCRLQNERSPLEDVQIPPK